MRGGGTQRIKPFKNAIKLGNGFPRPYVARDFYRRVNAGRV
jgi:hypothetical protein